MKLYGTPGACSLAAHIALREAELPFTYVKVDLRARMLEDGRTLAAVNPKGYVPVLEFDDGQRLTESAVVLEYIADQAPEVRLIAPQDALARYRTREWLVFTSTELHKAFGPLFNPGSSDEARAQARERVLARLAFVDEALAGNSYLVDNRYSVADIYMFVAAGWTRFVGIDIGHLGRLGPYLGRIGTRSAVQAALKAEGLVP